MKYLAICPAVPGESDRDRGAHHSVGPRSPAVVPAPLTALAPDSVVRRPRARGRCWPRRSSPFSFAAGRSRCGCRGRSTDVLHLMEGRAEALHSREVTALSTVDSPAVFAVKSLLLPIIPVVTLWICMAAADAPLRGGYFLIAVLTFLGAPDVLGLARIGANDEKRPQGELLLEITARWLTLVALISPSSISRGSRPRSTTGLLVTWFVLTPSVLFVGQWAARQWLTQLAAPPPRAACRDRRRHGARRAPRSRRCAPTPCFAPTSSGYFDDAAPARPQRRV